MPGQSRCFGTYSGRSTPNATAPAILAFHDLSDLFADSHELVFIDYCHTTESANARIATAIAEDITAMLSPIRPGHRKPTDDDGRPRGGSVN